jgi:hypothetical protein
MESKKRVCPDCAAEANESLDRRDFIKAVGVGVAATAGVGVPVWATPRAAAAAPSPQSAAETAVVALYNTLTDSQRREICYDWDFRETTGRRRGLLRTFVSNNWQITPHHISSNFYTAQQKGIIHDVFRGIVSPEWYTRFLKQLRDDTNGHPWGTDQSIAIFGRPGSDHFEMVMTGRHMTIRADGNTTPHVAFGGPIFYGHAAMGFNERPGHPGNVFWEQGRRANMVYQMLDGRQQRLAMVDRRPPEAEVAFRGANGQFPGIPVTELTRDQKEELQRVLRFMLEPYRREDGDEALECLQRQGGLDRCSLAFYRDGDIGNDGEWDNWRLEGPAFVWYFRGEPHVHCWVNIADDPSLPLNARG